MLRVKRRGAFVALAVIACAGGIAVGQASKEEGRIGPDNRMQPSGRQLNPIGKLTSLGNHPGGGTLTPDGRYLWAISSGRGLNDSATHQAHTRGASAPARAGSP